MKMLLDDTVYDIPETLIATWIRITPEFRDKLQEMWEGHKSNHRTDRRPPNYREFMSLADSFVGDNTSEYYQLIFDAVVDCKATMKEDFEDYAIDMTPDQLADYADEVKAITHVPQVKQPVRIDVT